jgi:hypothetical protein
MAELLENRMRLYRINPDWKLDSLEDLGEDLIGLVRASLIGANPFWRHLCIPYPGML